MFNIHVSVTWRIRGTQNAECRWTDIVHFLCRASAFVKQYETSIHHRMAKNLLPTVLVKRLEVSLAKIARNLLNISHIRLRALVHTSWNFEYVVLEIRYLF